MGYRTVGGGLDRLVLADAIEEHGAELVGLIVAALRETGGPTQADSEGGEMVAWREVGLIEGFAHKWPEVHEHYPPMVVYEGDDGRGPVRFCIGVPHERVPVFGSERGWASVWEVVRGVPREQRAVFVETDDFARTGDRIALIAGKDGRPKLMFAPEDRDELPAIYTNLRVANQKDVCRGPRARNRLGVLATDSEQEAMLNHALWHLRLRS
ncbi:MAG: hypothetical protein AB7V62_14100 [Thermoleophilia bacterium]